MKEEEINRVGGEDPEAQAHIPPRHHTQVPHIQGHHHSHRKIARNILLCFHRRTHHPEESKRRLNNQAVNT